MPTAPPLPQTEATARTTELFEISYPDGTAIPAGAHADYSRISQGRGAKKRGRKLALPGASSSAVDSVRAPRWQNSLKLLKMNSLLDCDGFTGWPLFSTVLVHHLLAIPGPPLASLVPNLLFLCGLSSAGVAQLVEHLICNQRVGGSIPSASSSSFEQGSEAERIPTW